jgi:anti-sigma B factor antagonist
MERAVVKARTVGDVQVVSIRGEIDLSNATEVRDGIGRLAFDEVSVIVVDLSRTDYLDSSGIAMLFRLAERLGHRRQELRLVVPPESPIRTALELTNLPRTIAVQDALG